MRDTREREEPTRLTSLLYIDCFPSGAVFFQFFSYQRDVFLYWALSIYWDVSIWAISFSVAYLNSNCPVNNGQGSLSLSIQFTIISISAKNGCKCKWYVVVKRSALMTTCSDSRASEDWLCRRNGGTFTASCWRVNIYCRRSTAVIIKPRYSNCLSNASLRSHLIISIVINVHPISYIAHITGREGRSPSISLK